MFGVCVFLILYDDFMLMGEDVDKFVFGFIILL